MKKVFLSGKGYEEKHFSQLIDKDFEIHHYPETISLEKLHAILPDYHAYVLGGDERLNEAELNLATHLKVISFVGTGYTSFIDAIAAEKRGIIIKNTPAVMAPAVVEHTLGLLIGIQRKLFQSNWEVKNNKLSQSQTNEISSLQIGIIGLGEIGSRLASILKISFGADLIYTSRTRKPDLESSLGIKYTTLDNLVSSADLIILAVPTTTETEYMFNEALFTKMKEGVLIINTAGARLIEPLSLKKYLDNHKIKTIALDGYYIEPLPNPTEDPYHLLSMPDSQVIVTPHIAAKTKQSWNRMVDMAINNIIEFFDK